MTCGKWNVIDMFKIAPVFILLKGQIVPKHQTFEDPEYMQLKDYLIPSPTLRLETYWLANQAYSALVFF